jgi:hypothetical protein
VPAAGAPTPGRASRSDPARRQRPDRHRGRRPLPLITLTGNVGSTSTALSQLLSPGTGFWTLSGNVAQTVFDAGALANKQRAAEENQTQTAALYRNVVLTAFQNVADTLRALQADARAVSAAITAERAAARNIDVIRKQVEQGQVSIPVLLTAQLEPICESRSRRAGGALTRLADGRAVPGARRGLVERLDPPRAGETCPKALTKRSNDPDPGTGRRQRRGAPRRRDDARAPMRPRSPGLRGVALAALQLGCWPEAEAVVAQPPAAPSPREVDAVRVTEDQMHQLRLATVEPFLFRNQKPAIGQIAFNEDRSTVVVTPFSGRVIRVIGKIGDEIKRADPLFEIDSPEVVQAQTDLIAALQLVQKAKSQLGLAKRVLDRQSSLLGRTAARGRPNAGHAAAGSDVTAEEVYVPATGCA